MRKASASAILGIAVFTLTLPSFADKIKGDTTLKDTQPYDTRGKTYTCRTDPQPFHESN